MKQTFEAYFPTLMRWEGGARYTNHPRDPGGPTKYGVTLKALAAYRDEPCTAEDVMNLTEDEAKKIYRKNYWNKTGPIGGDAIVAGPDAVLFDVCVNSGPGRAAKWYPIVAAHSGVEAIKRLSAARTAFYRSLSTFGTFGKGWLNRVHGVEAWALAYYAKNQGVTAESVLKPEADKSKAGVKKNAAGAGGVVATGGGASQIEQVTSMNWPALLAVVAIMALSVAYLIYRARVEDSRAEAMEAAING